MLLWIEKPFLKECEKVGVDSGKFYCGWKAKFRLNLQGVCDAHHRFTYILQHPSSASDYLSFVTSSLYQPLTEGSRLPNGYCLYGDNAYGNKTYEIFKQPCNGKQYQHNIFCYGETRNIIHQEQQHSIFLTNLN